MSQVAKIIYSITHDSILFGDSKLILLFIRVFFLYSFAIINVTFIPLKDKRIHAPLLTLSLVSVFIVTIQPYMLTFADHFKTPIGSKPCKFIFNVI